MPYKFATENKVTQMGMMWQMLNAQLAITNKNTIIAIIANKAQKCAHEKFRRVDRFQAVSGA